jgi:uncharacterized protein
VRQALARAARATLGPLAGAARDALAQRSSLGETGHRPWPLPSAPWVMGQTWNDLLFAHWRVDAGALRAVVPPQLDLDLRDGDAWVGVTPFVVSGLRLRLTPPLPREGRFPELNVRTYVSAGGKPGIYFMSLDAGRRSAVAAARRTYRLPYFHARFSVERSAGWVRYEHERLSRDGPPARLSARYRPVGDQLPIRDGSLERWLTERYCAYALDDDERLLRIEIHHRPWALRAAAGEVEAAAMSAPFGIALAGDPLLHFSARQDVAIWAPLAV